MATATPLVSILMTAYNREKYIAEAIESVLASTYAHFELIIVDDGSKDNTVAIARGYAEKDPRVRVFVNEKNLGDYPNRNKAAGYATGKYLKYVDADDAIYYWGLQAEVEMMERFPEAAYGLDDIFQDDNRIFPYMLHPAEAYDAYYNRKMGIFDKAPTSCIIKRDVFIEEKGFKPLRMVGDCEMWHRLSLKYLVLLMPSGIIWSRGHHDSESGKLKNDFFIQYHYQLVRRQSIEQDNC
ncbi:MAG: glycosyltransferase family 2 protein, partial [Bacteroidetes bacterium]|nr:glycosyltransferase family 2 protein [Bacteroidota bacterium]